MQLLMETSLLPCWKVRKSRGGSRGRVQGVRTPPPWDDLRFSNTNGNSAKKKTMSFTGVEEEQEMSAPPPKKNPGSAPEKHIRTSAYNHRSSECALLRTGTLLHCTWLIVKHSTRKGKTNLTEFNFFIWPSCVKPRKTKYSKRPTVPHKHLASTFHIHTPTLNVAPGLTTDLESGLLVSEVEFGAITANLRI